MSLSSGSAAASSGPTREFYGKPYAWIWFAVILFAVPLMALAMRTSEGWTDIHPAINAMLNGTSAVFLAVGYSAIRRRRREFHRLCMVTAFGCSTLFLVSYLARYATTGAHRYPGEGVDKIAYLLILFSHMILAALLVPLALMTIYRALKGRYAKHRKVARWAWPIWMYVSVTGVIVYLMLYPIARALYG